MLHRSGKVSAKRPHLYITFPKIHPYTYNPAVLHPSDEMAFFNYN